MGRYGTILHWDGNTWTLMNSGTNNHLFCIWGSSHSDVFATGAEGTILHYDGSTWTAMRSNTDISLGGVWGNSSDVFAVGWSSILRHDAVGWSVSRTRNDIRGIWGSSSSDVFAVGGKGIILRYSGQWLPYNFRIETPVSTPLWNDSSSADLKDSFSSLPP